MDWQLTSLYQFLREAEDGIEEAHLGFCHINDTLKFSAHRHRRHSIRQIQSLESVQTYAGKY